MFDYKVKKTEDCVLIGCEDWIQPSTLQICKISGKSNISYITKALDVHFHSKHFLDCPIKKGDTILLTKVASEIASMRSHKLEDNNNYFDVPIMQVLGIFKDNKISLNNLEMIYDKVLVEKVDTKIWKGLVLPESSQMIGIVVKTGSNSFSKDGKEIPLKVKTGDVVIIKDNVSTPINLDNKQYYALEEKAIVGIAENNEVNFINESILMKSYNFPNVLNSSLLIAPDINYEDLDYSDIYNRDLFQIKYLDKNLKKLNIDDIILVKRDYTNYVYFNQEKYFLINGKEYIEAKIER